MTGLITGDAVELRPLTAEDAETLRAIRREPSVERFWDPVEDDFPLADEPTAERFTIVADGEIAGLLQVTEEPEPAYRHAEIDLFLGTDFQGRGLGRDALRATMQWLRTERGHHRIVIGTEVENAAALRCYEAAGFRRIGLMEAASCIGGVWRDEIFMESVVRPASTDESRPRAGS